MVAATGKVNDPRSRRGAVFLGWCGHSAGGCDACTVQPVGHRRISSLPHFPRSSRSARRKDRRRVGADACGSCEIRGQSQKGATAAIGGLTDHVLQQRAGICSSTATIRFDRNEAEPHFLACLRLLGSGTSPARHFNEHCWSCRPVRASLQARQGCLAQGEGAILLPRLLSHEVENRQRSDAMERRKHFFAWGSALRSACWSALSGIGASAKAKPGSRTAGLRTFG